MYSKITNPETGRQVSIYGKRGQMVLRKYLTIIQQTVGGGFGSNDKWNGRGGGIGEYVDITGAGDPEEKFQRSLEGGLTTLGGSSSAFNK